VARRVAGGAAAGGTDIGFSRQFSVIREKRKRQVIMGAWGYGNFECDEAYFALGELFDHLIGIIRATFKEDTADSIYNDLGEWRIMANIDIMLTLQKDYDTHLVFTILPGVTPEEVETWKTNYLATYDRYMAEPVSSLEDPEESGTYVINRRQQIVATFDRLAKLAKPAK
jgi:hypothetical protein